MSQQPIYAVVHESGIEPFSATTSKEKVKQWIKDGYTVSEFTVSRMIDSVEELEK